MQPKNDTASAAFNSLTSGERATLLHRAYEQLPDDQRAIIDANAQSLIARMPRAQFGEGSAYELLAALGRWANANPIGPARETVSRK